MVDRLFEAQLSSRVFTGRTFRWQPGFYVTRVEGLLGGGSVSYESVALADGDGEFDLPNRRDEPRVITFSGFAYADSMWELGRLIRQLDGLLAARDASDELSWTEFGEWFSTTVRRGRGCSVTRRGATGFADFTMRFRAPSQRIYGPATRFGPGTSLALSHRGTYPAPAVFTVPGPHPGFTLTGPGGRRFVVSQPAGAGHEHTVDMRTGAVALDGARQYGVSPRADVWMVPPGAGGVATSCTVPFLADVPDTFI